ncbi:MAG: HYR domain-containing protein [Saprospiraceae bacterium]|nr:HYR domain-containing protein [Saprospiraceae bacterium]
MDTIPPVINCPSFPDTIFLVTGACDTLLNYTVTASDDQGSAIIIQLSGIPSGNAFPIGSHLCTYLATDLAGNTATCAFTVVVEDPESLPLCFDLRIVELDTNCMKVLSPLEVMEGGPYGCEDRYLLEVDKVLPFGNGPWVDAVFDATDIGKTYQSRVTDLATNERCWGGIRIVDGIPPLLNCETIRVSCAEENLAPAFLKDSLGLPDAMPFVEDACGPIAFMGFTDQNVTYDCDSLSGVVLRSWLALDQSNNSSTCVQEIKRHRHTIDEVQMPTDVTLQCPDNNTDPAQTGYPFVIFQGRRYDLINNTICDIAAFYNDFPLTQACGDIRVRRIWELFDFCTTETDGPFLQNIYIRDESAPTIACPGAITITVVADTCRGWIDMPDPVLDDACSALASFSAIWQEDGLTEVLTGSLADFQGNDPADFDTLGVLGMANLPIGTTVVSYVAEDLCGNTGSCTFSLTLADSDLPTARCDTFFTVYLPSNGTVTLPAIVLDNGSSDACTDITFKAHIPGQNVCQNEDLWLDSLQFCCSIRGDTLDAILRVYDIPVPAGSVLESEAEGHFTDCYLKINVLDTFPPLCVAPPDIVLECSDVDLTFESYGNVLSTSCSVDSIEVLIDQTAFDTICLDGIVFRRFKAYDNAGNTGDCMQQITVLHRQNYYFKLPDDVVTNTCSPTGFYEEPVILNNGCERLDVSFTDEIIEVAPDACYIIERSWRIVNACTYDSLKPLITIPNPAPQLEPNHPDNLTGPTVSACNAPFLWAPTVVTINPLDTIPINYCAFWSDTANGYVYKQIIKIVDNLPPTGSFVPPDCSNSNWETSNNVQFWNETYWFDPSTGIFDLCEEPTSLSITASDVCAGVEVDIQFLLFLDLDQDGTRETVIDSKELGMSGLGWNNVLYNNINSPNYMGGTPRVFDGRPVPANQKMGFAMEVTVSAGLKTATVRWNTQAAPHVYFPPEIPHGAHRIEWSITDNCGNLKEYAYNFTVRDCKTPTVVCQDGLTVNLLPDGHISLSAQNFLQYVEDNCTPSDQIEIGIRKCGTGIGFPTGGNGDPQDSVTYNCDELGNACIELWARDKAGNANFCPSYLQILDNESVCDNPTGIYGWVRTPEGEGVEDVLVEYEDNSPFIPPFPVFTLTDSTGYYALPGDNFPPSLEVKIVPEKDDDPLNGVTTYDLTLISQHILGSMPINSPYKLIGADANRSGSVTNFDIVELRRLILGIYTELPNNASWRFVDSAFVFPNPLNPFQSGFPEIRPVEAPSPHNFVAVKIGDLNNSVIPNVQFGLEERTEGTGFIEVADQYVQEGQIISIRFNTFEAMQAFQFTLEMEGLEFMEVLPEENMEAEHFARFPGNRQITIAWERGGMASFSIKAKATTSGYLREMLHISDRVTKALAYKRVNSSTPAALALRFSVQHPGFVLYQNQPNPFEDKTDITFRLSAATMVRVSIFDGSGRMVWEKKGEYAAGLHTVVTDLTQTDASGVLYYRVETDQHSAVRKMIRF